MLSFDVRSLAIKAAAVDGAIALDDLVWMPEDTKPDAPLVVTGRLSVAGNGRYYFSGRYEGKATMDCRRCLTPVTVSVAEPVAVIFSDGLEDDDTGDPDVFPLADGGKK